MKTLILSVLISVASITQAQVTTQNVDQQRSKYDNKQWSEKEPAFTNAEELAKSLAISIGEAEKVWSIYSEYQKARKAHLENKRSALKTLRSDKEKMNDEQYEKLYRANLKSQRERIEIDENYYNQLLAVLPASKVHTLLMQSKSDRRQLRSVNEDTEQNKAKMRSIE